MKKVNTISYHPERPHNFCNFAFTPFIVAATMPLFPRNSIPCAILLCDSSNLLFSLSLSLSLFAKPLGIQGHFVKSSTLAQNLFSTKSFSHGIGFTIDTPSSAFDCI